MIHTALRSVPGALVRQMAKEFVADLLSAMRERQLELRAWPVVFAGGGSILLLKRHCLDFACRA